MAVVQQIIVETLHALANFWNLALLLAVIVTLLWFIYRVFFRKLIRARRIANLRLARMMRERGGQA
jgi:hypothetical protein